MQATHSLVENQQHIDVTSLTHPGIEDEGEEEDEEVDDDGQFVDEVARTLVVRLTRHAQWSHSTDSLCDVMLLFEDAARVAAVDAHFLQVVVAVEERQTLDVVQFEVDGCQDGKVFEFPIRERAEEVVAKVSAK